MSVTAVTEEQGNWVTVRYDGRRYLFSRVATGLVQHRATYESEQATSPVTCSTTDLPSAVMDALHDRGYECVPAESPESADLIV